MLWVAGPIALENCATIARRRVRSSTPIAASVNGSSAPGAGRIPPSVLRRKYPCLEAVSRLGHPPHRRSPFEPSWIAPWSTGGFPREPRRRSGLVTGHGYPPSLKAGRLSRSCDRQLRSAQRCPGRERAVRPGLTAIGTHDGSDQGNGRPRPGPLRGRHRPMTDAPTITQHAVRRYRERVDPSCSSVVAERVLSALARTARRRPQPRWWMRGEVSIVPGVRFLYPATLFRSLPSPSRWSDRHCPDASDVH